MNEEVPYVVRSEEKVFGLRTMYFSVAVLRRHKKDPQTPWPLGPKTKASAQGGQIEAREQRAVDRLC